MGKTRIFRDQNRQTTTHHTRAHTYQGSTECQRHCTVTGHGGVSFSLSLIESICARIYACACAWKLATLFQNTWKELSPCTASSVNIIKIPAENVFFFFFPFAFGIVFSFNYLSSRHTHLSHNTISRIEKKRRKKQKLKRKKCQLQPQQIDRVRVIPTSITFTMKNIYFISSKWTNFSSLRIYSWFPAKNLHQYRIDCHGDGIWSLFSSRYRAHKMIFGTELLLRLVGVFLWFLCILRGYNVRIPFPSLIGRMRQMYPLLKRIQGS